MGSIFVVMLQPELGFSARICKGEEGVFVEELVADARVQALDVGILGRLAWSDEVPPHIMLCSPFQELK